MLLDGQNIEVTRDFYI